MKKILKKATLENKGQWKTTITWYSLGARGTKIEYKQDFYKPFKDKSYTKELNYNNSEFDKAYDMFHKLIKDWI